jgi:hypothetical protein
VAALADRRADGWRDALAIVAAYLREDVEGVGTVVDHCEPPLVIAGLVSALLQALTDRQVDPADWVRNEQDMLHCT